MFSILPEQRIYMWDSPRPSRGIVVHLKGTAESQSCSFMATGPDGRSQPVVLKHNKGTIQIVPWVPGSISIQVDDLFVNGIRIEPVNPIEIEVLSPFVFWKHYDDQIHHYVQDNTDSPEARSFRPRCDMHDPVTKRKITRFIRANTSANGRRILWLSGRVGSGKTFLLHHHVLPELQRNHPSYDFVHVEAPTERWHILAALEAKGKEPKGTYPFVPTDQYLDVAVRNRFRSELETVSGKGRMRPSAILIDSAYLGKNMPDAVFELLLATLRPGSVPLPDEFILIVADVMSLDDRLQRLQKQHPKGFRDHVEEPVETARRQGLIKEISIEGVKPSEMPGIIKRTTGCTQLTSRHVNHLLQLTGGNRFLMACVLDNSCGLYRDSRPEDSLLVVSEQLFSRAGQLLFDRMCRAGLMTSEQASEFADSIAQRGIDWRSVNAVAKSKLDLWKLLGIAVTDEEHKPPRRFCIPRAFEEVKCKATGDES